MRYKTPRKSDRLFSIWSGMKKRCNPKNTGRYKVYAGKGIKNTWLSYDDFERDMYDGYAAHAHLHGEAQTTIDRIDVSGHYSKENCRWATWREQWNNRSTTHKITHDGRTLSITEWAREKGVKRSLISSRINREGWEASMAIDTPEIAIEETTSRPFIVVSPDGKEYSGVNLSKFCREMGLCPSAFGNIRRGYSKTHKGWRLIL